MSYNAIKLSRNYSKKEEDGASPVQQVSWERRYPFFEKIDYTGSKSLERPCQRFMLLRW